MKISTNAQLVEGFRVSVSRSDYFDSLSPLVAMANSYQPPATEHNLDECSLYGSWIFSLLGAAIAIPVGIKKKSLAPLVFFGSTGAMLDIVQSFADCERERIEKERAAEFLAKKDPSDLSDDLASTMHFLREAMIPVIAFAVVEKPRKLWVLNVHSVGRYEFAADVR